MQIKNSDTPPRTPVEPRVERFPGRVTLPGRRTRTHIVLQTNQNPSRTETCLTNYAKLKRLCKTASGRRSILFSRVFMIHVRRNTHKKMKMKNKKKGEKFLHPGRKIKNPKDSTSHGVMESHGGSVQTLVGLADDRKVSCSLVFVKK